MDITIQISSFSVSVRHGQSSASWSTSSFFHFLSPINKHNAYDWVDAKLGHFFKKFSVIGLFIPFKIVYIVNPFYR